MSRFAFNEAIMHFARVDGPKGFIWKYALAYGLGIIVLFGLVAVIGGGAFVRLMQLSNEAQFGVVDEAEMTSALMGFLPVMLLSIPLGILFWVVFEGALQRRYMRQEGFSLKLGADEGRLFVVGLWWLLAFFVLYLLLAIVVGGVGAAAMMAIGDAGGVIVLILGVAAVAFLIWFVVRLSPASAVTVRDRKITFFGAMKASKGRFWPMLGAFLIMAIIATIVSLVMQVVMGMLIGGAMMANPTPTVGPATEADAMAALFSPAMIIPFSIAIFLMYAVQAVVQFAWAGVPAKAAITDPNWAGAVDAAETFS